jgi:hypothetical protein
MFRTRPVWYKSINNILLKHVMGGGGEILEVILTVVNCPAAGGEKKIK